MMEMEWDSTNLCIVKNKYVIKNCFASLNKRILNNGI